MSDIVKEAFKGATTTTSEAKKSTLSGKLSSFTIGKIREEFNAEEGTWMKLYLCLVQDLCACDNMRQQTRD